VIAVAAVGLIALALIAYVAAPLLRRRAPRPAGDRGPAEVDERRRSALAAIVDLEADHAMGKLTDEDFEALKRDYEDEALVALRELDALHASGADELEREIAQVRRRLECPECGAPRREGVACPSCGHSTPAGSQ